MKISSLQFGTWMSTSEVVVIRTSYFEGVFTPSGEQPKNTLPFFLFYFESQKILMGWENCFLPSSHGEWLANDSNTQIANSWIQSLHLVGNAIVDALGTLRTIKESSHKLQDGHLALTEFWDCQGTRHIPHPIDESINHTVINIDV